MKKILKIAVIVIPVLVIAVLVVLFFALNSIVKAGVETVLPQITGTTVKLDKVSISMFSGKGSLSGLVIGNPEGFKTDNAFSLGNVQVDIDIASLLTDRIVIEEIVIDAPQVTYEMGFSGSNIGKIQENIEKFAGPPAEKPAKPGKKVEIRHFLFRNGKVSVSATMLGGQKLTVPLPPVDLHDIGKEEGGKSIGDMAKEVFTPVSGVIGRAVEGAKRLIGAGADAIGEGGKKALEAGKGVINTGTKAVGGAVNKVKDLFK